MSVLDQRVNILHILESKNIFEWTSIILVTSVMILFGNKLFESTLFTIGQLAVVIIVFALYYDQKLALYLLMCGLVAFEENVMSNSYDFWNPSLSSTLMEMRIAGIGIFDAITFIFLIPVLMREFAKWHQGEKLISFCADTYLIPFVVVYLFGMITGLFNMLSFKNYIGELHDLLYIPAFYFIASRTFKSKKEIWIALTLVLVTFSFKSLIFVRRYLQGGGVFFGYDYYRIALGTDVPLMAILVLSLMVIFILSKGKSILFRVTVFLGIGYTSILLISTIGRSTYILTIISLITLLILLRNEIRLRHVVMTIGMGVFGGLIFVFFILSEQNRELISYAITTAFNWVEAIKFYGDLSLGERILEFMNIWATLIRDQAVLLGNGWGSAWSELVVHHPFNKGSYPVIEQFRGVHTSAHVDAVFFLLKVGIIGTIFIYFSHLRFLKKGLQLFQSQLDWNDKSSLLILIAMMIIFIPNYTYFAKLKVFLGIVFGAIAVLVELKEKKSFA